MPVRTSTIITEFSDFFKATKDGEDRYFATHLKPSAIDFDERDDPVRVKGFGVYDTTVATDYCTAVYADRAFAEAHVEAQAPKAPTSAIETETHEEDADEFEFDGDTLADEKPATARKKPAKKRGR